MIRTASKSAPGFKKQAFGVVLAVFGIIDTGMNLLTGIALDGFFLLLIVAGVTLFIVGGLQNRKDRYQATCG